MQAVGLGQSTHQETPRSTEKREEQSKLEDLPTRPEEQTAEQEEDVQGGGTFRFTNVRANAAGLGASQT